MRLAPDGNLAIGLTAGFGGAKLQVIGGKTVSLLSPGYLLLGLANSTNPALGTRI
jgi:hypothetical protein